MCVSSETPKNFYRTLIGNFRFRRCAAESIEQNGTEQNVADCFATQTDILQPSFGTWADPEKIRQVGRGGHDKVFLFSHQSISERAIRTLSREDPRGPIAYRVGSVPVCRWPLVIFQPRLLWIRPCTIIFQFELSVI